MIVIQPMHYLAKSNYVLKMSAKNPPKLRVNPDDIVALQTEVSLGETMPKTDADPFPMIDLDACNPSTGPIFVNGAEPGDTLVVDILDIQLVGPGLAVIYPGWGAIKDDFRQKWHRVMPIRKSSLKFSQGVEIPVKPLIGTIGVAPLDEEVSTLLPGPHGGNLDITDITFGSTVFLPVFVQGALFALGDVKATMGDGELSGGGIEVAATTTVRVSLIKRKKLMRPRIETRDAYMTVGIAKSLEEAIRIAMKDMVEFLANETTFTREEAYFLLGAVADAKIGNVVNPEVTVRVSVPKSVVSQALGAK